MTGINPCFLIPEVCIRHYSVTAGALLKKSESKDVWSFRMRTPLYFLRNSEEGTLELESWAASKSQKEASWNTLSHTNLRKYKQLQEEQKLLSFTLPSKIDVESSGLLQINEKGSIMWNGNK